MEDFSINKQQHQFELDLDGEKAIITYRIVGDKIHLNHTEVPKSMQGKGIGNKIVEHALKYIKDNNLKVVPNCSFVAAYIARHPEWKPLTA